MTTSLQQLFPGFARQMHKLDVEDLAEPLTDTEIQNLEKILNIELPPSYKRFLKFTRGFTALGRSVQLGFQHPFFHEFEALNELSIEQQKIIKQRKEVWPPPSNGMLCFAEFFMEADGDQVLFDITQKNKIGEYPVYYYAHEDRPPSVRKIADSFEQWLNEFGDYKAFQKE